eukprot:4906353-Pyramimonas_sp.AAC.1
MPSGRRETCETTPLPSAKKSGGVGTNWATKESTLLTEPDRLSTRLLLRTLARGSRQHRSTVALGPSQMPR